jgi:hypothetical protein
MIDYLDRILYLYPEIQGVSYWHTQYTGEAWDDLYDGIVWENTEIPKPSKEQLEALDAIVVESEKAKRAEIARKVKRNTDYAKDLSLIANYANWGFNNPGKTFSEYLDYLETINL